MSNISTDKEYRLALDAIEPFLKKGFSQLTVQEEEELIHITKLIAEYEAQHYHLPFTPKTLVEMIELKMFELKLKQRDLAKLLGVTENRISEVLNGKRKINIDLAKKLYIKLDVDPQFILSHV